MTRKLMFHRLSTPSLILFPAGGFRLPLLLAALALMLLAPARTLTAEPLDGPRLALKSPGTLLIVGGGKVPETVHARFLQLAGGEGARLVVIPTASAYA